ncbi:MAG: 2'-5' RNA ligase family protein [Jatrophihabitans sp.]|nr:MAG: 2'-5' RNA ligase family protein [Jatrophihabitans sp.]
MRDPQPQPGSEAASATLGVAIAVPQPHATVLRRWRRACGDPAADRIWPHVTLLPPTPVPLADWDRIEEHLATAARVVEPFSIHLSGTGTFRPTSPVVFVQVANGVAQCETLERAIRQGPLARELQFPYHPHVTVAQEVPDASLDLAYDGLAEFTARFAVTHFVLFSRTDDRRWEWRTEFLLGA